MIWLKRIGFFVLTNLLVMLTVTISASIIVRVFHLEGMENRLTQLAIFCGLLGMGGAFVSLALSRISAKWMYGIELITPGTANSDARAVLEMVHQLARKAGLPAMPEVGIYESDEVNAFATGPTKSRSLVAVSSGLLRTMDRASVEGVLGHEISHIANGDMVTMTLLQGIINAVVMFVANILSKIIASAISGNDERRGSNYWVEIGIYYALSILLGILGSVVVCAFSRWREFRADAGSARISGRENMVKALRSLQRETEHIDQSQPALAAFKISNRGSVLSLFATHPPLQDRIARLESGR